MLGCVRLIWRGRDKEIRHTRRRFLDTGVDGQRSLASLQRDLHLSGVVGCSGSIDSQIQDDYRQAIGPAAFVPDSAPLNRGSLCNIEEGRDSKRWLQR